MKEIWKEVKGTNAAYLVSNMGRVKNFKTNNILCPYRDKNGYETTKIVVNYKRKTVKVNRLVVEAFLNPNGRYRHKNGIKWDNRVENLEEI